MLASAPRLIRLTSPDRPLDRELLHARGGFAWWYLDAVNAEGDGVTLIWSFGLPFLPGYESAARRGDGQAPRDRPSLNVVAYRGGREAFYLLQEYAPHDATWSEGGTRWSFGDSVLESRVEAGTREVRVSLDCPIPGTDERLRGEVRLDGVTRQPTTHAPVTLFDHDWAPRPGPARAEAALRVGDSPLLSLEGRGYHDRNGSRTSFSSLGIRHWVWGRVPLEDRELIYYLLWPTDDGPPEILALEIDEAGATVSHEVELRLDGRRRARFGMPYWEHLELRRGGERWLTVRHREPVDDGPFYLRFFTDATDARGERHLGTGELVRPARVDLAPLRRFVDMRVHRPDGETSRFNPLFTGPRADRVTRQLSALLRSSRV